MIRIRGLIIIMAVLLVGFANTAFSSEPTASPSPTPTPIMSLFPEDTCAPPCWFGLTPGESTIDNVIAMFKNHRDQFYVSPELRDRVISENPRILDFITVEHWGRLLSGQSTSFIWREWHVEPATAFTGGYIAIEDNILQWIHTFVNEDVSLQEVLSVFGMPAYVREAGYLTFSELALFYPDKAIVVIVYENFEECVMEDFLEQYRAEYMYYFSINEFEILQADRYLDQWSPIDPSSWTAWISEEISGTCEAARQENRLLIRSKAEASP